MAVPSRCGLKNPTEKAKFLLNHHQRPFARRPRVRRADDGHDANAYRFSQASAGAGAAPQRVWKSAVVLLQRSRGPWRHREVRHKSRESLVASDLPELKVRGAALSLVRQRYQSEVRC